MPWRIPWCFVRLETLSRLQFRAVAGDQLGDGIDALILLARNEGGCGFIDKLEGLRRMHRAHANGDPEELSTVLDKLGLKPCPQK